MTETKDNNTAQDAPKKKLSLSGKGTLSLKLGGAKTPSTGGGTVEIKRRRAAAPPPEIKPKSEPKKNTDELRLTNEERESRAKALRLALADGGQKKTTLPKRHTIEDMKKEEAEQKAAAPEPQSDREKELEELRRIEADEKKKDEVVQKDAPPPPPKNFGPDKYAKNQTEESYRDRLKKTADKPTPKTTTQRRGGRITVTQAINRDYDRVRGQSMAAQKRAREKARMAARGPQEPAKKVFREVIVPETITVQELSNRMTEQLRDVIKALMKLDIMASSADTLDADTAELVIEEFGHTIKRVTDADVEIALDGNPDREEDLIPRPPVVTIMGHVDHGKTSLLDALRQTDMAAGEAGGITQHIGAYQVTLSGGDKITFLDTPGHAAFTEMRARGANATDIVIIVVSAEDSIMPQTIEAISHAKAADVPIIIAINKIDLPDANPAKVKQDLLQYDVIVEELSGDVQCVEVSAKQKINLDKLEETVLLQAEFLELLANPKRLAQGVVIESKLEKGRGPVVTVLVKTGTLKVGDTFVAGEQYGKIRALVNCQGHKVHNAIPGQPVEILGLSGAPASGSPLHVVEDDAQAREVAQYRDEKRKKMEAAKAIKGRTTIEQLLAQKEAGEVSTLAVIIKADVHGSVEAITGSFEKMVEENEDIAVKVLHSGTGGITESDITLANASNALIIGFNVRANMKARAQATRDGVDVRYYNVIYNVIDDTKMILTDMLPPLEREEYLGNAEILEVFNITKVGKIAGCTITTGTVKRGSKVRLLRDDVVIHEGMLKTLKRHKDEVKDVKEGVECGMAFENYEDLKVGDVIECFEIIEEAREVV